MTQAEKFPDPFCSRAMLICSIIWLGKADVAVVVRKFVLVEEVASSAAADLYCSSCFYVKLMQIN